ncbi:MAG TPA: SET domain-containing protein [Parachlamydiaceae bacterium]|nr:SET domain-containing protein [Parachlamydiaceae bacterium]
MRVDPMTPLHQAVIDDDYAVLSDAAFVDEWRTVPDNLGFTALEIAKFLGNYKAVNMLGSKLPDGFRLHPNGMKMPVELSLEGFEKSLGFLYRPFLTFTSYSWLKRVVHQCPYILRCRSIASENYAWAQKFEAEISEGKTAPIYIKWIDSTLGYGVFASEDIAAGVFVGEYTGVVRRLYRKHPDQNPYCFHYPTKFWSLKTCTVDSMHEGNITRFINHSNKPNLQPICAVDRGLLHLVFLAGGDIKAGQQLTFDYGEDYWMRRKQVAVR